MIPVVGWDPELFELDQVYEEDTHGRILYDGTVANLAPLFSSPRCGDTVVVTLQFGDLRWKFQSNVLP